MPSDTRRSPALLSALLLGLLPALASAPTGHAQAFCVGEACPSDGETVLCEGGDPATAATSCPLTPCPGKPLGCGLPGHGCSREGLSSPCGHSSPCVPSRPLPPEVCGSPLPCWGWTAAGITGAAAQGTVCGSPPCDIAVLQACSSTDPCTAAVGGIAGPGTPTQACGVAMDLPGSPDLASARQGQDPAGEACNRQAGVQHPRPAARTLGGAPYPPKVKALASVSCTCYVHTTVRPWGEEVRSVRFRIDGLAQVTAEPVNLVLHWDLLVSLWMPARGDKPHEHHAEGQNEVVTEHWFTNINPAYPAAASEQVPTGRSYEGYSQAYAWLTTPPVDDPMYAPGTHYGAAAIGREWHCSEGDAVAEEQLPEDPHGNPHHTFDGPTARFTSSSW